ncbi:MAG: hypothetical protein C4527_10165 [Candidatus Omnitrophota bacterium]|jgi:CRISPR-associated protein Csm4|nr:MAG: hypothetical protein C4527_10165 [Candidatus Omnitrophota bacterium]
MQIWRLQLRLTSLQLTDWQADTLFGHLCWALRHREGEEKLSRFLQPFRAGEPPFLLTNGFPAGFLPLPFHCRFIGITQAHNAETYQQQKRLKQARYLSEPEFANACRGETVTASEDALELVRSASQLHAAINRLSGTTTGADEESGASLFQLDGWVPGKDNARFCIFLADRAGNEIDRVFSLFQDVEKTGFGKKKSSGMGAFRIDGEPERWNPPSSGEGANGFVTLSGFVPTKNDPVKGFWQMRVKHGKLGESFAAAGKPFKRPWVLFEPGSIFFTGHSPAEVYGSMLSGLSNDHPEVVQYAYAFPIPIRIPPAVREKIA